jgi:hypothetical protein
MSKVKTQTGYQAVGRVLEALIENKAHTAVAYLSDRFVVRMTMKRVGGKLPADHRNAEISLTIGKPNYEQREFIRQCKKAGEPLPVKKIQLKFPSKRKGK